MSSIVKITQDVRISLKSVSAGNEQVSPAMLLVKYDSPTYVQLQVI